MPGTCMDQSWLRFWEWTPSAPSSIDVHVDTYFDAVRKLVPVLKIEWKVATDASIQYLKGVELTVLQVSSNQQVCVQFDFQNNLLFQVSPNGGGRWNFSFNQFEVQPGQVYQVTVQHLPSLSTPGDHNWKSMSVTVPDCTVPLMKTTVPCLEIGSLWEPNIDGISLADDTLLVSFNPALEAANYYIHVISFQDEQECKKATKQISELLGILSQCSTSLLVYTGGTATATECDSCAREKLEELLQISSADYLSMGLPGSLTFICFLLVGSAVASAICLARRHKVTNSGANNSDEANHDLLPASQTPPPLKPCKVWIVYSADHKLYVDVVMKFAQFMITVCGTEVVLDLLNERQISEMGPVRWLTRQKQEMEALSSKIIILCSRGTRAKWQAMLGRNEIAVSLRQDNLLPIGDMFTPALNLILPDFKQPACFGTYLICYFEGISNERDIPDPFNVTSKYQLMDKFEEIYFLIQDLEKFEPGRIHQIPEISPDKYSESPSGRQLKEALQTFKKWQTEHPDWFKKENSSSESADDLQSLNGGLSEELTLLQGGIVKHQLIPQEPVHNSCCLVNLLATEDELGAHRLLPQLLSEDDRAFQTLVVPADDTSQVQMVVPFVLAEEGEILSHQLLTNEDRLERMPMTEASLPRRNSAILQDNIPSDSHPLSVDVRQQLGELMYSLYQQSITPCDPPLCQDDSNEQHGLVFDSCKDQRQSVQSDQGYISRCSPLPSDGPVEEEEEEEDQEQEGQGYNGSLSQDVLDSLKSLQQQLLFQDIQHNFS
ncbi:hypothetical protein JD844_028713 [Phrynosoma platyrhinos]|uniref:SEFIR domain-containing protein n=1 Tax=Phrynosoma platyrhinos TaxID=52577 RepID=A0ABQ7SIC6_PHRPL|nr:hypothetical protein JD844_028713 [Phrynosoma platyrhinos]